MKNKHYRRVFAAKRVKTLFGMLLAASLFLLAFSGCAPKSEPPPAEQIKLGVVEATGYADRAYLHMYDASLQLLGTVENDYANYCEPFNEPVYLDGSVFTAPRGRSGESFLFYPFFIPRRDAECVVAYDLQSGAYTEYETGLDYMNCMTVSADAVYAANTIDFVSHLVRTDRKSGETVQTEFPDVFLSELYIASDNTLYALAEDNSERSKPSAPYLYVINGETLALVQHYALDAYGTGLRMLEVGDWLYVSSQYDYDVNDYNTLGQLEESMSLTAFHTKTHKLYRVEIGAPCSNNLSLVDGKLWISNVDEVTGVGSQLTLYDPSDGNIQTFDLGYEIEQMSADSSGIYVLGNDGATLCKYALEPSGLRLLAKANVPSHSSEKTYFYKSSFFFVPAEP